MPNATAAAAAAPLAYTVEGFAAATNALFTAANPIDRALSGAEHAKMTWGKMAAMGVLASGLTVDGVKDAILTVARAKAKNAKAKAAIVGLNDVSSTVKGWFYDFKAAADAGEDALRLILNGTPLTSIRRALRDASGKGGKGGKAKGAAATGKAVDSQPAPAPVNVVAPVTLAALADQLEQDAKRMSAKAAAGQAADIARIIAAASTLAALAEKGAAAPAKASAPRKAVALAA